MIKHIISSNPMVNVRVTSPPYIMDQGLSAGQVRFNINNNDMEVYDGRNWFSINQTVTIDLHPMLDNALNWVTAKMNEEERLRKKAELFPSIKEVMDDIETLKEKLNVLDKLCNENELDNVQKTA